MPDDQAGAGVKNHGGLSLVNCMIRQVQAVHCGSHILNKGPGAYLVLSGSDVYGSGSEIICNLDGAVLIIQGENLLH